MGKEISIPEIVADYKDSPEYNISIDLYTNIVFTINSLISNVFNEQHIVKSYFFSCMEAGAFNDIHMDNYYQDDDGEIHQRLQYISNKSGLLYLNDDYEGGELIFPNQKISLKPETGTLVFFEGDYEKPHGVQEVKDGLRYNLVTFYEPVN